MVLSKAHQSCSSWTDVSRLLILNCTLTFVPRTSLRRSTPSPVSGYNSKLHLLLLLTVLVAVLTLCACTPPLDQVLLLWDFLLAFGVHLNVLCVIAQLLLMRDEVMHSSR